MVEDAVAGIDAAIAGGLRNAGVGSAANYEKTEKRLKHLYKKSIRLVAQDRV